MSKFDINYIPAEKFEFAQAGKDLHDEKFKTKPIGYFQDAWIRFKKNTASIAASIIILMVALYAIVVPFIANYELSDRDGIYTKSRPYVPALSFMSAFDGGYDQKVNDKFLMYYVGIGMSAEDPMATGKVTWDEALESKYNPVISIGEEMKQAGKTYRNIRTHSYFAKGFHYLSLTQEQYDNIVKYQEETGIQVLYPMIDTANSEVFNGNNADDANFWYKHSMNGTPVDANGKQLSLKQVMKTGLVDNYVRDEEGNVVYFLPKDKTMVQVRVLYYNYYQYVNGAEPTHYLGTDGQGYDIFVRLAYGLRTSLLMAVLVSAINLIFGAIYGAIEGYYGGWVDLIGERISDILSGIPFMVLATLVQLHLVATGIMPTFAGVLLAFCLTGWIGVAYRVRTQFYRFKNQEYVLAARTLGARDGRLMFKHIFPNALGTIITSSILIIPSTILSETTLSYLGIVNFQGATSTSLGTMLSNGKEYLSTDPHIIAVPAIAISLLMISFNLFGNGLRDAFNPSLRGVEE